jgi:hypothetical protein
MKTKRLNMEKLFYAGLTKEDFYFGRTQISQKFTGLNMNVFVCPNFNNQQNPKIWIQNNYNKIPNDNLIIFYIKTCTISKIYKNHPVNLTIKDFESLKIFVELNKKLLLSTCNEESTLSSMEIINKVKNIREQNEK